MKIFKKLSALVISAVISCTAACIPAYASTNIADASRDSVVYITNAVFAIENGREKVLLEEGSSGTGFAIGKKGQPVEYIVTNAHVTEKTVAYIDESGNVATAGTEKHSSKLKVYFNQKTNDYMIPEVVYFDAENDFCILKLPEATTKREPLPLADVDKVHSGDTVYVLGYPDYGSIGQSETIKHDQTDVMVAKGVVAKRTRAEWFRGSGLTDMFMTDVISSSGNSGGPTITEDGAVLGIYSGRYMGGSNSAPTSSGVSISIAEVIRALNSLGIKDYEMAGSGSATVIIVVIIAVVAVAAVAAIIFIGKKKNKNVVPATVKTSTASGTSANVKGSVAIVGVSGQFKGSTFVLKDKIVIGRNPANCTVCYPVDTKGVSGVHCEIIKTGESKYEIVDRGSSNGTFLGSGQKLQPNIPVALSNGFYFYLGSTEQMFQIKEL